MAEDELLSLQLLLIEDGTTVNSSEKLKTGLDGKGRAWSAEVRDVRLGVTPSPHFTFASQKLLIAFLTNSCRLFLIL